MELCQQHWQIPLFKLREKIHYPEYIQCIHSGKINYQCRLSQYKHNETERNLNLKGHIQSIRGLSNLEPNSCNLNWGCYFFQSNRPELLLCALKACGTYQSFYMDWENKWHRYRSYLLFASMWLIMKATITTEIKLITEWAIFRNLF